jgi:hypothetical protein
MQQHQTSTRCTAIFGFHSKHVALGTNDHLSTPHHPYIPWPQTLLLHSFEFGFIQGTNTACATTLVCWAHSSSYCWLATEDPVYKHNQYATDAHDS